jgi:peptidyl-prolyl cis-trans isomerase SurA
VTLTQAKPVELDSVAVIVNQSVILESEVQTWITNIKTGAVKDNQDLPSENALRTQVLDRLINESLILQIGERMGIQISDSQLNDTLKNIANSNNLTLEELRQGIINDGLSYEKYRESIRTQLISGEVKRASVRRRIYISEQETANLLAQLKEQTNNTTEYHLGHILVSFPTDANQAEINATKERAEKVIKLLNNGGDFTKIAIASSGGENALKGGDFGWKNINDMPTLFSEVVNGQEKGAVFGPIRTGLGFSIVKILDLRGRQVVEVEEVNARHILIIPSIILSEAKAEQTLQGFLDKISSGDANFADLAKEHSEGPTSINGGDLGWSDPNNYDPAFKEALAKLAVDEYSQPFRSSFGWHIAQLTGRRTLDATEQVNENRAYQMLYNRKFEMESARWIKETRDSAYIEVIEQEGN